MTNQHKKSNLKETLSSNRKRKQRGCVHIVNPENDRLISPELMVAMLGTAYSYTPTVILVGWYNFIVTSPGVTKFYTHKCFCLHNRWRIILLR